MLENVVHGDMLLAIIVRAGYKSSDIEFLTPGYFPQQLGCMNRGKGYVVEPHMHNMVERSINLTQEVLFIRKGKVRVDFYGNQKQYLESRVLLQGDVALLAHGGHGLKMIEESDIIEVKQGPYVGDQDKTRFKPVHSNNVVIR